MGGIEWNNALEILIFWIGIFLILRSLRGTRGLGVLKGGVGIILGLYLISKLVVTHWNIDLSRLNFVIEHLVTVALIAFVIIFQPEVRRGLTRLGEKPFSWLSGPAATRSISPIAEAAGHMSRRRIGALIVIERNVGISGIIESGVPLSAEVTAPLLESIFYPNAPLHDGAVVVRGSHVVAASCLLPLSDNPDLGPEVGTRHRAAVGLTEETDAIVVVVSEQTGRMSVSHYGVIRPMRDIRELENSVTTILDGGHLEASRGERAAERVTDQPESRVSVRLKSVGPGSSEKTERDVAAAGGEKTVRIELPAKDKATAKERTTSRVKTVRAKPRSPDGEGGDSDPARAESGDDGERGE